MASRYTSSLKPLLLFALSVLSLLISGAPALGSQKLLYAIKEDGHTTIFSYELEQKKTSIKFSDADSSVKLMSRGGAGDSVNVISAVGKRMFAIGKKKGFNAPAGFLYELAIDGSNHTREIAEIKSESPVMRIAVDRSAKRVAYAGLIPDKDFVGEGESYFVSEIVIHDIDTGKIVQRVDLLKRVGTSLVGYLDWNPKGDILYLRIEGDKEREGLFEIDGAGSITRTRMPLDVLKKLVQQTSDGYFVTTYLSSTKIEFQDKDGKVIRSSSFSKQRNAWHCELSSNDQYLAFQTIKNEIWFKDLKSGEEQQVPIDPIKEWGEYLTLIGWID